MILVKFGSGRFGFSGRSECAPKIYSRQCRVKGGSVLIRIGIKKGNTGKSKESFFKISPNIAFKLA
jgi:hypothetical protein